MSRSLLAAAGGLIMALGLGLSGLTNPGRIVGFLDFTGRWDPTALFVMAGAAAVFGIGYRLQASWGPRPYVLTAPPTRPIDGPLIAGALTFGVGWGLSGLCPGPAITALAGGAPAVVVFVVAMAAGMLIHARTRARR